MKRLAREYGIQAVLLLLMLVPIFPGVFIKRHLLAPASYVYTDPPWSAYRPDDLTPQNPLGTEVPISVCLWYTLTDASFGRGEWPLWNPLQFAGAPLIANFQTAVFYPPRLLFMFFRDTLLSLSAYILLRFWLCGLTAFACARFLGLQIGPSRLFSVAYMLAGYNLLWCFYPPPDVMAWFPLLFLSVECLLQSKYRPGVITMALSLVMMITAGHPSSLLVCCVGLSIYALGRFVAGRSPAAHIARCGAGAAVAFTAAFAVCAVQLLPFIEYLPHSALYINLFHEEGVAHYTYAPIDLLSLWAPRMLGTELEGTFWGTTNHTYLGMLYVGIPIWVGVFLLLSPARLGDLERSRVRIMLMVSAVCLYLGTNLPGASYIQNLPLIDGVRPAYFVAFPALALPLASAYGYQAWRNSGAPLKHLLWPLSAGTGVVLVLLAASLVAPVLSANFIEAAGKQPALNGYVGKQVLSAALLVALTLSLMAVCAFRPGRLGMLFPALILVLLTDQALGIRGLLGTSPRRHFLPHTQIVEYLQNVEKPCRTRPDVANIMPGYLSLLGVEELYGYDAVFPKRFLPFLRGLNAMAGSPVDRLIAAPYVLFPAGAELPQGYEPVMEAEGILLAHNTRSLPRARLVGSVKAFETTEQMVAAMKDPQFDPERVVFTEVPPPVDLENASTADAPGLAEIVDWTWQSSRIEIDAARPCVLVLAETFYPGWKPSLDGHDVDDFPVYSAFRGVAIPQGKHTLEYRYVPASFRVGYIISTAAVGTLALAGLALLLRRRAAGVNSCVLTGDTTERRTDWRTSTQEAPPPE